MKLKYFTLLIIFIILLCLVQKKTYAKPWVWARFTKANKTVEHSNFEKWCGYFYLQADDDDTAYLTSMAWDDENIYTVNGIDGDNSIGINYLASLGTRTAPIFLLGDANYSEDEWNHVLSLLDSSIDTAGSTKSYLTHNKMCFVSNKAVLISSANNGQNGFNYQHNNSLILWYDDVPGVLNKIEKELFDQSNGFFHSQTTTGNIYHYSPTGDTIEMRFSPDDNNNGLEPGAASICGRLRYLLENAKESIIYMANSWGSTMGDPNENAGNMIKDSIINNTTAFKIGAKGSYSYGPVQDDLINDHTCRIEAPMNNLHSKVFIIDLDILSCGSANISNQAMVKKTQNDESNIIIHDFRIVRRYMSHFHHIMSGLDPDNVGGSDQYDSSPPDPPTNLSVTADQNNFYLTWAKPAGNVSDFSRYYIFIDSNPIKSNKDLGDRIDDDSDGYYDEDPIGDIDRFASNSSGPGLSDDDDADGLIDEDPFLFPEKQIKDINTVSAILNSYNVGDSVESNIDYWFAVVAVDTQGNESLCDTYGPYKLGATGNAGIIITEVFYDEGSGTDWLEVYNYGLDTVSLENWQVLEGEDRRNIISVINNINGTDTWIIGPGQYAVISPDAEHWYNYYNDTPNILFDAVSSLSFNLTSQEIGLFSGAGTEDTIITFTYPDKAFQGNSIELVNIYANPNISTSWQASNEYMDISPGTSNTIINYPQGNDTDIIITEIMYDVPLGVFTEANDEWIEIYNKGIDTVSISGWTFGYWTGSWTTRELAPANGDLLIGPKEFAVLHENAGSWYTNGYGDTPETLIDLSGDITLDGTGDSIALFNITGDVVEEFFYPNKAVNASIERKNFFISGSSSINWEAADYTNGETHTGGLNNTVAPPQIEILSPLDFYDTCFQTVNVSGSTINTWSGDSIVLYINSLSSATYILNNADDTWSLTVDCQGYGDTVTAELYSVTKDNPYTTTDTITINYFDTLLISLDLQFTDYDSVIKPLYLDIVSTGTIPGDTLIIFNVVDLVTDTIVLDTVNDTYYDTITLSDYGDTLRVTVFDQFGRSDSSEITVNYYENLTVSINSPEDNCETYASIINISGTTLGTDYGATVTVSCSCTTHSTYIIASLDGDFSGTVALHTASESIVVYAHDRFGRSSYDTITINYFPEPSLKITFPNNFYDTNSNIISISGTSLNSNINDTISIFVNDTQQSSYIISSANSNWTGTVTLTSRNDTVIATLKDRFGRVRYDTIIVSYFDTSYIGITYPWIDYDTTGMAANVLGTSYNTIPGDSVYIYVNNIYQSYSIITDTDGSFSGTATLSGMGDSITAKIISEWGEAYTDTQRTNLLTYPYAGISLPYNNYETNVALINISGTTLNTMGPDKVELYVNQSYQNTYYISEENETWTESVELTGLNDSVSIKLTDQFGRIYYDTINTSYYPIPQLEILFPEDTYDTYNSTLNISGTISNGLIGDSILIFLNNTLIDTYYITSDSETWSGTISFSGINDSIIVKTFDRFNYETCETISISFYDTPLMQITYPENNDTSVYNEVTVSGTLINLKTGDTIEIFVNGISHTIINYNTGDNNLWTGTAYVSGLNDSIVVKITDQFSRYYYDTISISFDTATFYNVEGIINTEARGATENIYVYFYEPGDSNYIDSDITSSTGSFSLYLPENFTGYIRAYESHHLISNFQNFTVSSDTNLGVVGSLIAGDINGDNRINPLDGSCYKAQWDFNQADINGDGSVSSSDLQYIRDNFGLIGDEPK